MQSLFRSRCCGILASTSSTAARHIVQRVQFNTINAASIANPSCTSFSPVSFPITSLRSFSSKPEDAATSASSAAASTATAESSATPSSTPSSTSSSSSSSSGPRREPTDAELLSPGQRSFFKWSDWILGGFLGLMVARFIIFLFDSPDVLDEVTKAAEEDELIQARVGSPVKWSMFWSGNVNEHNASLVIPITGPKGAATLHVRAMFDRHFNCWKLMLLQVSFDASEGAQKHSLTIPDRMVIKPRYVSPEEAERIRKKYEAMQKKIEETHYRRSEATAATSTNPSDAPSAPAK